MPSQPESPKTQNDSILEAASEKFKAELRSYGMRRMRPMTYAEAFRKGWVAGAERECGCGWKAMLKFYAIDTRGMEHTCEFCPECGGKVKAS